VLSPLRRAAWAAVALIWGWLAVAGAVGAAPALWRVQGAHNEIYLFGTLHALPPDLAWRTRAYDAAYAKARVVWFEAGLDQADPQTINQLLARYGTDRNRPLSGKLPPAALAELGREVDVKSIDHLRPWAAAMMLSIRPMLTQGARVEAGADFTVSRAAHAQEKTVRAFETLEDQARLFASLSEAAEVRYLTDVIERRSPQRRRVPAPSPQSLAQSWMNGDLPREGRAQLASMQAANPDLYEALIRRRNLAWADALARELADGSEIELVNVGALHLVGDDGLPALLAARGLRVERVQ